MRFGKYYTDNGWQNAMQEGEGAWNIFPGACGNRD